MLISVNIPYFWTATEKLFLQREVTVVTSFYSGIGRKKGEPNLLKDG